MPRYYVLHNNMLWLVPQCMGDGCRHFFHFAQPFNTQAEAIAEATKRGIEGFHYKVLRIEELT